MARKTALFLLALAFLVGCGQKPSKSGILRIGYQKWSTVSLLRATGQLEPAALKQGIRVEWLEFSAGPPLLEALNAGSIDLGHTGDSPPLFAQAAGIPFVYLAASSPSPESSAILVKDKSDIRSIPDLKGKRIGFSKGTSAHTLVVRVLEKNNLAISDITPIYLAPADGRAALESGAVDAWSIWDPYLAATENSGNVRRLVGGTGYVAGREYYLSTRQLFEENPKTLQFFLEQLQQVKSWAKDKSSEVNRILAEQTRIDPEAIRVAESRRNRYETGPITQTLIQEQQALADRYLSLGLLPHRIEVKDLVVQIPFWRTEK